MCLNKCGLLTSITPLVLAGTGESFALVFLSCQKCN